MYIPDDKDDSTSAELWMLSLESQIYFQLTLCLQSEHRLPSGQEKKTNASQFSWLHSSQNSKIIGRAFQMWDYSYECKYSSKTVSKNTQTIKKNTPWGQKIYL